MKENTKLFLNVAFWCLAAVVVFREGFHTTTTDLLIAVALIWWNLHDRFRSVEGRLDRIERKLDGVVVAPKGEESAAGRTI
jgi:hypothetical protein